MSDRAVGVAVLYSPVSADRVGFLCFIAEREDGSTFIKTLRVVAMENLQAMTATTNYPLYSYVIDGTRLWVEPSIMICGNQWIEFIFPPGDKRTTDELLRDLNPQYFPAPC